MVSKRNRTVEKGKPNAQGHANVVNRQARSLSIAREGVTTGSQFASMMSNLMCDVVEGSISPAVCQAACSAGRNLLMVVKMQLQHQPKGKSSFLLTS